jgi:peroxiredoxin
MIAFAGCFAPADRVFDFPLKNKPALDFELTALDGPKAKLGDYRGKPIVLAFFAYQ